MKKLNVFLLMCALPLLAAAKDYYMAPNGNDRNDGSKERPFATLSKVQQKVKPGDIVYIRGGIYKLSTADIMGKKGIYHCVVIFDKSGTADKRIAYYGYPGERPVFDLSGVTPSDGRISGFYVSGSYLHFRNFEITGIPVVHSPGNTQSECISNRGGNHNIYENLAMHDGMGIGFYLVKGSDNLILNCDAYNNFDSVSGKGTGGNVDGFGGHPDKYSPGNVFRGCRAWWNSDDGFDLIHSGEAVTIEHCWAFYNGYRPGVFRGAADGNGIKAGGYGMKATSKMAEIIPVHTIKNCIAFRNKASGFYANHHLGGLHFYNNSSYMNRWNYNMLNRKSKAEPVNVPGYGHVLKNNLSFMPRQEDLANLDTAACTVSNNSFLPTTITLTKADFISLDPAELMKPRKKDGSLPDIKFLVPVQNSKAAQAHQGYTFEF